MLRFKGPKLLPDEVQWRAGGDRECLCGDLREACAAHQRDEDQVGEAEGEPGHNEEADALRERVRPLVQTSSAGSSRSC